ncbi:unnamed protein product, partial [Brassica rapa subsp. narinosa]
TLAPLSSVYKSAHVRSSIRWRVHARTGTGGFPLAVSLLLFCFCFFLTMSQCRAKHGSVSPSIYSRIWVSDSAPGSSMLERSVGSSGTSVSSGFAVRWYAVSSCEGWSSMAPGWLLTVLHHFGTPLLDPRLCSPSEGLSLLCGVCLMLHVCSVSVWHQTWILSALSVVSSVLEDFKCRWRFSVAVVDRSSGSLGCAHIPALHKFICPCVVVQHYFSLQVRGFRSGFWWCLQPVFCLDRITSEVDQIGGSVI